MYRVVLYPTKSTTLALTDISFQKFSKWNRTPKGSPNFSNVRVYLFVDTRVTMVYIVLSYPTKSTTLTLTDVRSLQKFSKWNRTPKGSSNFSNVRVYIFVSLVISNQKYDPHINRHRFPPKIFKMEPNAERLVEFW